MIRRVGVLLALVACLSGCHFQAGSFVQPMALSDDQRELMELIRNQDEILLFELKAAEAYTRFDAWVEIYENGELVVPYAAAINTVKTEPAPWQGTLAIRINENASEEISWGFVADFGNTGGVARADSPSYPGPGTSSRSFGTMEEPVTVEEGMEIVLAATVYTDRDTLNAYSCQEYVRSPEYIAEQENLHLIKCKFSN